MLSLIISQIKLFIASTTSYLLHLAKSTSTVFTIAFACTTNFLNKYYLLAHAKMHLLISSLRIKLSLAARSAVSAIAVVGDGWKLVDYIHKTIAKYIPSSLIVSSVEPMQTIITITLIYLAFKAFKTRTKNLAGIFITPALFTILAINLALKYYVLNFLDLFVWIFSTIIFSLIGYLSINQGQIKYDTLNETFRLLGSKFNLAFTILILLANYYLNYQLTTNPINLYLITLLSLNNSLFGLFIGRWLAYVIYADNHSVIKSE